MKKFLITAGMVFVTSTFGFKVSHAIEDGMYVDGTMRGVGYFGFHSVRSIVKMSCDGSVARANFSYRGNRFRLTNVTEVTCYTEISEDGNLEYVLTGCGEGILRTPRYKEEGRACWVLKDGGFPGRKVDYGEVIVWNSNDEIVFEKAGAMALGDFRFIPSLDEDILPQ